jgi:hypothetical protein
MPGLVWPKLHLGLLASGASGPESVL